MIVLTETRYRESGAERKGFEFESLIEAQRAMIQIHDKEEASVISRSDTSFEAFCPGEIRLEVKIYPEGEKPTTPSWI